MKKGINLLLLLLGIFLIIGSCNKNEFWEEPVPTDNQDLTLRAKPGGETAGNNLSFPYMWAEVDPFFATTSSATRMRNTYRNRYRVAQQSITPATYSLAGEWWYWWGFTPGTEGNPDIPWVCEPSPANPTACLDGSSPGTGWEKVYLQKDPLNKWQATTINGTGAMVYVDRIDWGDNLESVDWNTRSKIRTEIALYIDEPAGENWVEYLMRHLDGWGIDELHGVSTEGGAPVELNATEATVYSHCARLVIQKLSDIGEDGSFDCTWNDELRYWTGDSKPPLFSDPVYKAGDGPGYFSAEINVKGKIIYGYTWDVRRLQDPEEPTGVYRLTFALDEDCGSTPRNTSIAGVVPEPGESNSAHPVTDEYGNYVNATYIDVTIVEGNGKPGGGSNNGGGNGGGNQGGGKGNGG